MKVLLDMPVSASLLDVLREHGHEGVHACEIDLGRATDIELLKRARCENRVIITADLDFPQLLALSSGSGPWLDLIPRGQLLGRRDAAIARVRPP